MKSWEFHVRLTGASQAHSTVTWSFRFIHNTKEERKVTLRLPCELPKVQEHASFPRRSRKLIGYQSFEENMIALTEDIANDKDRWVYNIELKRMFMKFAPFTEAFVKNRQAATWNKNW